MTDLLVVRNRGRLFTQVALLPVVASVAALAVLSSDEPRVVVAGLLVALAVGLAVWMSATQRTVLSNDGIAINGFARVRRISWDEIAKFEVRPARDDPSYGKAHVVLRDGRAYPLAGTEVAFGMISRDPARYAREAVALLNSRLDRT